MTGYQSKKAAAQDKLLDDDDTLTIAYATGYYDGKKAAQPAQEPPQYSFKAYWAEDGRIGVVACIIRPDGGPHIMEEFIDPPQPAQEPVAYLCKPDQHGLFNPPTPDKACKDCFPVYRQLPQRTWVGLTDEDIQQGYETTGHYQTLRPQDKFAVFALAKAIEAKLKEKNT